MFAFSPAHSHALTNATRRHEYFRGLSRLLPVPGVLVSFLELRFLGKMALLALGGRPQPLKKPSQSQKGHFYKKMNALNDTKTAKMSKSAEGNGEYLWWSVAFVEAWIKGNVQHSRLNLYPTQKSHKIKPALSLVTYCICMHIENVGQIFRWVETLFFVDKQIFLFKTTIVIV